MASDETLRMWRLSAEAMADVTIGLLDEVDALRALLKRVRCYAVVDPLGNPSRMLGIESEIDDALGRVNTNPGRAVEANRPARDALVDAIYAEAARAQRIAALPRCDRVAATIEWLATRNDKAR